MQCQDNYSKEPYGKITSSRKDNTSVISKTDFLLCLGRPQKHKQTHTLNWSIKNKKVDFVHHDHCGVWFSA